MRPEQYSILNSRRDSFNNLIWQAPMISLTAQAFLFTIALGAQVSVPAKMMASFLACITAIASVQLLIKHRFAEKEYAIILEDYERTSCVQPPFELINQKLTSSNISPSNRMGWLERRSSYHVWILVLSIFAICAACISIFNLLILLKIISV